MTATISATNINTSSTNTNLTYPYTGGGTNGYPNTSVYPNTTTGTWFSPDTQKEDIQKVKKTLFGLVRLLAVLLAERDCDSGETKNCGECPSCLFKDASEEYFREVLEAF